MIFFSKRVLLAASIAVFVVLATGCSDTTQDKKVSEPVSIQEVVEMQKVYVALEGDGAVAVIDVPSMTLSKKISLTSSGKEFMAHNVQVAPDGKTVWITANAMEKEMHSFRLIPAVSASENNDKKSKLESQLIIIDPITDTIQKRIPLGMGLELAHVVLTPDSGKVIATSQEKGTIFVIDAKSGEIIKKIAVDTGNQPHGVRVLPDGSKAYVALMKGKGMVEIDLVTYNFSILPLQGSAVQVAVTPNGKMVAASLYDVKKMAVYTIDTKETLEIALPENARGPLQMYPTPDSKYMYLADQGYYSKQPEGEKLYKVDIQNLSVVSEISVGKAPHGVVVSPDGKYVFVTNLLDKSVSVVDTVTDVEIAKVRVGKEPNGISYWSSKTGGTP